MSRVAASCRVASRTSGRADGEEEEEEENEVSFPLHCAAPTERERVSFISFHSELDSSGACYIGVRQEVVRHSSVAVYCDELCCAVLCSVRIV